MKCLNTLLLELYKYERSFNNKKIMSNLLNSYKNNDFYNYVNIQHKKYTRKVLLKNNNIEVCLLSWYPGSSSKIHGHSHNGCYMKVLEGCLEEYKYDPKKISIIKKNTYMKNSLFFIDNSCYHKIENPTIFPAFSLHIYSPPEYKVKFYTSIPK